MTIWELKKLSDVCEVIMGQSPPGNTYNKNGTGLPFFQGKTDFGSFYPTPSTWCTKPKKIAEPNDILISVRAPVGPTNMCNLRCCIGRGLTAIRTKDKINPKFVLYYLRSVEADITSMGTGSTFQAISKSQIANLEIPLAPPPVQKLVVSEIEKQFSRLDEAVAAMKRVKASLKYYKASVLKAAVEGKLTEEWRKNQISDLTQDKRLKDNKLPIGWIWKRVSDLGEVITGTTPTKAKKEYYDSKDYPFFKPTDLNDGYYVKKSEDGLSKEGIEKARLLPTKSILVTCIGATIGKTGLIRVSGAFNQQINAIIPQKDVLPEFVYFVCISPQFQKSIIDNASATTLPILNKRKFEMLTMPMPPLLEQQKIVEEIESRLSVAEEIEEAININLKRAERLRQAIFKKAFSGRLVTTLK